jgi:tetraacyldisaccharide 4'-kinase
MSFSPLSSLYSRILEARARRGASGLRLAQPVVSVGNVTTGGTGKTPVVQFLAGWFRSQGWRPAILSRGYGRASRQPVLVSSGEGPLVGPEEGGDEPVELARHLRGTIVAVASRRRDAAELAARLGADLFLLDDGFQHLALQRDVDLVLLDARDPFGGEKFPPRGRLREPLSALARADAFLLTHASSDRPPASDLATLARWNPQAPLFHARLPPAGLFDDQGSPVSVERVERERSIAVCGVASPASFAASLAELGLSPQETLVFRDHQRYGNRHLAVIGRAAERAQAAWVVTTEKDAVKLAGRVGRPLVSLRRRVEILEPGFFPFLESRLARTRVQAPARPAVS